MPLPPLKKKADPIVLTPGAKVRIKGFTPCALNPSGIFQIGKAGISDLFKGVFVVWDDPYTKMPNGAWVPHGDLELVS